MSFVTSGSLETGNDEGPPNFIEPYQLSPQDAPAFQTVILPPPWALVLPLTGGSLKTENIWMVWKLGRSALPLLVMLMFELLSYATLLPMLF